MKTKRIVSLLLAIVMTIGLIPLQAFAGLGGLGGSPFSSNVGKGNAVGTGEGLRASLQFVKLDYPISNYDTSAPLSDLSSFSAQSTGALFDVFSKRLINTEGSNFLYNMYRLTLNDSIYIFPGSQYEGCLKAVEATADNKVKYTYTDYEVSKNYIVQMCTLEEPLTNQSNPRNYWYQPNYFGGCTDTTTASVTSRVLNYEKTWQALARKYEEVDKSGDTFSYEELRDYAKNYISSCKQDYLDYWKYLCDSFRAESGAAPKGEHGQGTGGIRSDKLSGFLTGSAFTTNENAKCWLTVVQQYILAYLLDPRLVGSLDSFYDSLNRGDDINTIPIIYLESLVGIGTWNESYAYTLDQVTAEAYNLKEPVLELRHNNKTQQSTKASILSYKIAGTESPLYSLTESSYGMFMHGSKQPYYMGSGGWHYASGGDYFAQNSTTTNESITMTDPSSAHYAQALTGNTYTAFPEYQGYSFVWSLTWTGGQQASLGVTHEAFWIDSDGAAGGDHSYENTKTIINRSSTCVDDDGYYVVTGDNNETAIAWLESDEASVVPSWCLELYAKSSTLTSKGNDINLKGTYQTGDNAVFPAVSSYVDKPYAVAGSNANKPWYCRNLSTAELIKFLKGESVVTFTDTQFHDYTPTMSNTSYLSQSMIFMRVTPANSGFTDYPWAEDMKDNTWVSDEKKTIEVHTGSITTVGKYEVIPDVEYERVVYDEDIGYYTWTQQDSANKPWEINMHIYDLSEMSSEAKNMSDSALGTISVNLTGYSTFTPFLSGGFTLPAAKQFTGGTAKDRVLNKLSQAMAEIISEGHFHLNTLANKSSGSKSVSFTGEEARAFIEIIKDKEEWGVTGHVLAGTQQSADASISGIFGATVTWDKPSGSVTYTLGPGPLGDTAETIYPVGKDIIKASAFYQVTADPLAKEISLTDINSTSYKLGTKVATTSGDTVYETALVNTTFNLDSPNKSNYTKIASGTDKGEAWIKVTRAEVSSNGTIGAYKPVSVDLNISPDRGIAGTLNSYFSSTGNIGEFKWNGTSGFGDFLKKLVESGNSLVLEDKFTSDNFILSKSNPTKEFSYKVEVKIKANYMTSDGYTIDKTINFDGRPDNANVSWYISSDLIFNSDIRMNFAELKHQEPMLERFEALSGVPVTENLYYSTGGHEFVIQSTFTFIENANATRNYTYTAKESACEDSWIATHNTSLDCVQVQGTGCDGHDVVEGGTPASVGTCTKTCGHSDGDIVCGKTEHSAECTCTDPTCTKDHTSHTHSDSCKHTCSTSCYNHPITSATLNAATHYDCTVNGWTKTNYILKTESCSKCGRTYSVLDTNTVTCKGEGSGSYSTNIDVSPDCKTGTYVKHDWKHCRCCCPKSLHQECNPHTATYSETWVTKLRGFKYMQIKDCRVWQLSANYLEADSNLLKDSKITGGLLADENDEDTIPPKIYFWAGDTSANEYTQNVLNRFVYFWHPEQHQFEVNSKGEVIGINDDVSLNSTSTSNSGYAGDGQLSDTLYTDDTCDGDRFKRTYEQLHKHYLQYIKSDTDSGDSLSSKGWRFGGTVMSDFLILAENEEVNQSIYYMDYSIYAGSDKSTDDDTGTSLYDLAQFGKSMYTSGRRDPRHSQIQAESCYRYRHYDNADLSDSFTDTNGNTYSLWSQEGFWYGNPTSNAYCYNPIETDGIYIGGYNGKYYSYDDKYIGTGSTVARTPIVSNFDFSKNSFLIQHWQDRYCNGYLKYRYKNHPQCYLNPEQCASCYAYHRDKGRYFTTQDTIDGQPTIGVRSLPNYDWPRSVSSKFRLGRLDLDINNSAPNGIYEQKSSKNFYKYILEYSPGRSVAHHGTSYVKWAGANGFEADTNYSYRDGPKRYINEVVVYVPMAADIGLDICRFDDGPMKNMEFVDDRVESQKKPITGINLEADGWIHFPLVSYIKEKDNNRGLYSPVDYITDIEAYSNSDEIGYGGTYGSGEPLEVSKWCENKWVTVDNYIIVDTNNDGSFADERVYSPNEDIMLEVFDSEGNPIEWYHFYIPEMAWESGRVTVNYYSQAINNSKYENVDIWDPNNVDETKKSTLYRYHGAKDTRYFQTVGRIGNLTMTDTGDFRYSNFFKNVLKGSWVIPNVVYEVNPSEQVRVVIDEYDIFGRKGGGSNSWNTYGSQEFKESLPKDTAGNIPSTGSISNKEEYEIKNSSGSTRIGYYAFPLLPKYNNIQSFIDQPMRVGYTAYLDVETIGDYASGDSYVTVEWSYYGIEKGTNNYIPLDVYMVKDGKYELINNFDNDTPVYDYPIYMNWQDEKDRRMQTDEEKRRTDEVEEHTKTESRIDVYTGNPAPVSYYQPTKTAIYQGTPEATILGFDSRTFIGNEYYQDVIDGFSDSSHTDPGDYIPDWLYYASSQKWYFSNQLPSSAVFVESNKTCDEKSIKEAKDRFSNVIVTGYIVAHGDVWNLVHDSTSSWTKLKEQFPPTNPDIPKPNTNPPRPGDSNPDNPTPPKTPNPPTVITIIPIDKSSKDDMSSVGTH